MHVLILGSHGMLGKEFALFLKNSSHTVTSRNRAELDITNEQSVTDTILMLRPHVIINCAAYTDVDRAEAESDRALQINGNALSYIGATANTIDAFVVHFSTDYVFSGKKKDGYDESETEFDPCNVYGASKLSGERQLMESGCAYAIVRISWLFGKYGKNFINNIRTRAQGGEELSVVTDQHGKPTYTLDVVRSITAQFIDIRGTVGVYHLPNEGECTWYDLAVEICLYEGIEKKIRPCTSETFVRPAARPMYSVLVNTKLPRMRPWKEAVHEYLKSTESLV